MLRDGVEYAEVITRLGEAGKGLIPRPITDYSALAINQRADNMDQCSTTPLVQHTACLLSHTTLEVFSLETSPIREYNL